ncbi:MAG: hypothetical protein ACE5I5_04335 [Candidatus Heimdallarchaeota archaeon]
MFLFRKRKESPILKDSEIENLLALVSYFDSVRDGHFHTPKDIEERTQKVKDSRSNLKYGQNVIKKTLSIIKSAPGGLAFKIRLNEIIVTICIVYGASLAIFMTLFMMGGIPDLLVPLATVVLNPTTMTLIGLLLAIYIVLRGHIKSKSRITAKQHLRRTRTDVRMKRVVQFYLDQIPRELRKKKIKDPSKILFNLFYNDYEGIKTVKGPGIVSDTFTVYVDMRRGRDRVKRKRDSR